MRSLPDIATALSPALQRKDAGRVPSRPQAMAVAGDAVGADVISIAQAPTLDALFRERVRRSPDTAAYRYFDEQSCLWRSLSWSQMAAEVARWQAALIKEGLERGDRVAVLLHNCKEWVMFDQAALGLGLVVVPLYYNDRADNIVFILQDAGVRLLLIRGEEQWQALCESHEELDELLRVVTLEPIPGDDKPLPHHCIGDWLPAEARLINTNNDPDALATIVYTSGTTGRPKGVMLSHRNIVWNAFSGLQSIMIYPHDLFLSFLPLSHTFERTVGYYLPMMAGAAVAHARSISYLAEDMLTLRPTGLISVPRIFERVYAKLMTRLKEGSFVSRAIFRLAIATGWKYFKRKQRRGPDATPPLLWPILDRLVARKVRERFGGRLRCIVCGGAPLSFTVARTFLALGLPMQQGYGLTESSPVISVNPLEDNDPKSVGLPLQDVEVRIGEDNELLVRSPGVMLGYWNNHKASYRAIDRDGWLHTGDQARLDDGHVYITGRLKEILVLANGEKVPPADLEMAVAEDPLFQQVMIVGEGKPYLGALVVLNPEEWSTLAASQGLGAEAVDSAQDETVQNLMLERIARQLEDFPGYANVYQAEVIAEPWTVENEMLTPTLKLRRKEILSKYAHIVDELYEGHDLPEDDSD